MKLNWGSGILMAFVAFIAFILYFVVLASTDQRANHDLVTDHYYEDELGYQEDIDAMENARGLTGQVTISGSAGGITVQFPESLAKDGLNGTIALYRPSNKKLDFELPLRLEERQMIIPADRLPEGRWDIAVRWNRNGRDFLIRKRINYSGTEPANKIR